MVSGVATRHARLVLVPVAAPLGRCSRGYRPVIARAREVSGSVNRLS